MGESWVKCFCILNEILLVTKLAKEHDGHEGKQKEMFIRIPSQSDHEYLVNSLLGQFS